jgi:glycosyltransferase involved in cell wall biosynthesis
MTADTVGGVWDYSLQLAAALDAGGTEVVLATMGPRPTEAQREQAAAIPSIRLAESDYPLEWMEEPWDGVAQAGAWLRDLADAIDPDVVHLNGYVHAALPWRAPVVVVAHSCVCSWWMAVHGCEAPESWTRYRRAVRAGLYAADAVVAPSHAMLAALSAHHGPIDGVVIPNGRDVEAVRSGGGGAGPLHSRGAGQLDTRGAGLPPSPEAAADHRSLGGGGQPCAPVSASGKEPLILAAGRLWDPAKNIGALAAIADRLPWPVAVAGDLAAPGNAKALSPSGVLALGRLPAADLRTWLDRTSIYALPARYEPFGLSVLEAALARAALVLGDITSLRENWDGAGWFVPPSDTGALHAALARLIEDDERRAELGRRAYARAREFSVARMARGYRRLYAALLGQGGRRAAREAAPCAS